MHFPSPVRISADLHTNFGMGQGVLERGAILEIKLERGALKAKKGVGARSDFRISWSAER